MLRTGHASVAAFQGNMPCPHPSVVSALVSHSHCETQYKSRAEQDWEKPAVAPRNAIKGQAQSDEELRRYEQTPAFSAPAPANIAPRDRAGSGSASLRRRLAQRTVEPPRRRRSPRIRRRSSHGAAESGYGCQRRHQRSCADYLPGPSVRRSAAGGTDAIRNASDREGR